MNTLISLSVIGLLISGCGQPPGAAEHRSDAESASTSLFDGAVSVRKLDSMLYGKDLQLELTFNEPGSIRIGYGPEGRTTS